jgi:hypothetical protein
VKLVDISRREKRKYLEGKINELETKNKKKNLRDLCRGISEFKKGCQPRSKIVKEEKGDLVADSHSILNSWRNHFSQLLNVHGFNDVRQAEMHLAEPVVPEPSTFEFDIAIEKTKRYKSPGINQIPAELIFCDFYGKTCGQHSLRGGTFQIDCFTTKMLLFPLVCMCRNFWSVALRLLSRTLGIRRPSDFFLFPKLKLALKERIFHDISIKRNVTGNTCGVRNKGHYQMSPTVA